MTVLRNHKAPASAPGDLHWDDTDSLVEVEQEIAVQLLAIPDGGFVEVEADPAEREAAEKAAAEAQRLADEKAAADKEAAEKAAAEKAAKDGKKSKGEVSPTPAAAVTEPAPVTGNEL